MRRSILVIAIVAVLSAWIGRADRASGVPRSPQDWIRTADGWEQRAALVVERPSQPTPVHPGLVATFQLGVSLMVLLAFPGRAVPVVAPSPVGSRVRRPLAAVSR